MIHIGPGDVILMCCVAAALLFASHLWFYLRVLRPVARLAQQAQQLERGDLTALEVLTGGIAEVVSLRRAMASMAQHVRRAQLQQVAYAEQMAEGRESERKRIAQDLHDTTVQSLIAVAQTVDLARAWLADQPERATDALSMAREQAVSAVTDLRDRIADLRPPALEELGLVAALQMLAGKTDRPRVEISTTGTPRRLSEAVELTLYRAAQEALTNAARHGEAASAQITLDYTPDTVTLTVRDDGRGFTVPSDLRDLVLTGHYGLMGIQERVGHLGGSVSVTSAPGQGTTVTVRLPVGVVKHDETRDPVCGAVLAPGRAYGTTVYQGRTYAFCCPVCQGAFEADPARYVAQ